MSIIWLLMVFSLVQNISLHPELDFIPDGCIEGVRYYNWDKFHKQYEDERDYLEKSFFKFKNLFAFATYDNLLWGFSYNRLKTTMYRTGRQAEKRTDKEISESWLETPVRDYERQAVTILAFDTREVVVNFFELDPGDPDERHRGVPIFKVRLKTAWREAERYLALYDNSICLFSSTIEELCRSLDCALGYEPAMIDNPIYREIFALIDSQDKYSFRIRGLVDDERLPCSELSTRFRREMADRLKPDSLLYSISQEYFGKQLTKKDISVFADEEALEQYRRVIATTSVNYPDSTPELVVETLRIMADYDTEEVDGSLLIQTKTFDRDEIRQIVEARKVLHKWKAGRQSEEKENTPLEK